MPKTLMPPSQRARPELDVLARAPSSTAWLVTLSHAAGEHRVGVRARRQLRVDAPGKLAVVNMPAAGSKFVLNPSVDPADHLLARRRRRWR